MIFGIYRNTGTGSVPIILLLMMAVNREGLGVDIGP